jgi:hypothetical protein
MKISVVVAWLLLVPAMACGQCVEVEGRPAQPPLLAPNFRIVVTQAGKPVDGARILLRLGAGAAPSAVSSVLVTDREGVATPPDLKPGDYLIQAWTADTQSAEGIIRVADEAPRNSSTLPIVLYPSKGEPGFAKDKGMVASSAGAFSGVVVDPAGAPIPGSEVDIWEVGDDERALAGQMSTDIDGRFSHPLQAGHYVAIVRAPGFRTRRMQVEITSNDSLRYDSAPVTVGLTIGSCP